MTEAAQAYALRMFPEDQKPANELYVMTWGDVRRIAGEGFDAAGKLNAEKVIAALRKCDPGAYMVRAPMYLGDADPNADEPKDAFKFDGGFTLDALESALHEV